MKYGYIITVEPAKGFGFIRSMGQDYFFHASDLRGTEFELQLCERRVKFDDYQTDRGPRATNIELQD